MSLLAKRKENKNTDYESNHLIGGNLTFAGAEAYKMLRTNIEFSLPDKEGCHVVGVTSGLAGEGKSTTCLNLAYTLAEAGRKVLLIEGDMRLPQLSNRLNIKKEPGLSDLLVRKCKPSDVLQPSEIQSNLYVICAGNIPPNPAELLGSSRMEAAVELMSKTFEYILIDLPPVNVVTDALVTAKYVDGMVLVVMQGYATRKSVADMIRMMQFHQVNILGFVMNSGKESGGSYRKKYGYDNYGYYGNSYAREEK